MWSVFEGLNYCGAQLLWKMYLKGSTLWGVYFKSSTAMGSAFQGLNYYRKCI